MSYTNLADLKGHLRITGTGEDTRLQTVLDGVTENLESATGQSSVASYTEYHTLRTDRAILPRKRPLVTVTSITPDQGSALDSSLYVPDTEHSIIRLRVCLSGLHTLVYTAGRASVPKSLTLAAWIICQHEWSVRNGTGGRPSPDAADQLAMVPGFGFLVPHRALELMRPYLLVKVA